MIIIESWNLGWERGNQGFEERARKRERKGGLEVALIIKNY